MTLVNNIKKLHNISDATVQKRLSQVRIHFKLRDHDEVTLEKYLAIFKR